MARFDTPIQENPEGPSYQHYLGGTSQPEPNQAGKFRGAGWKLTEGLLQEGVQGVKNYLHDDIYRKAEPIREQYVNDLTGELSKLQSGEARLVSPTNPNAPATATGHAKLLDIPVDAFGEVPPGSDYFASRIGKELPSQLEAITGAKKSGKISPTYYYMSLDRLAQDYRTKFPGFVDYIDEQFNKFTGREVANKAISSLTSDINSYADARAAGQGKVASLLSNQEIIGVLPNEVYQDMVNRWQAGDPTVEADILRYSAPGIAADKQQQIRTHALETEIKTRDLAEKDRKFVGERVTQDQTMAINDDIDHFLSGTLFGGKDSSKINLDAVNFDDLKKNYAGTAGIEMAQKLQNLEYFLMQRAQQRMLKTQIDGKPATAYMSTEQQQQTMNLIHSRLEYYIKGMGDGDFHQGVIFDKLYQAQIAEKSWGVMQDSPAVQQFELNHKLFPSNTLTGQAFDRGFLDILKGGSGDALATFARSLNSMTGINGKSLADNAARSTQLSPDERRKVFGTLIDFLHEKQIDPNTQITMFQNISKPGFWKTFEFDRTDPYTNEHIPGGISLWARVYNNEKTWKQANALGIGQQFADGMVTSLSQEIWQRPFEEASKLAPQPWVNIRYRDDTHQWIVGIDPAYERLVRGTLSYQMILAQMKDVEFALNTGMQGLIQGYRHNKPGGGGENNPEMKAIEAMAHLPGIDLSRAHAPGSEGGSSVPQQFLDPLLHILNRRSAEEQAAQEAADTAAANPPGFSAP